MTDLIINRPDLQTLRQRYTFSVLTLVFWTIWLYLWLPLVSFVAWLIGVDLFREQMIMQQGYLAFIDLVGWYLLVIVLMALSLLGWAGYNLARFGKKNRRVESKPVTMNEVADYFDVSNALLARARAARRVVVHYDEDRRIARIEVRDAPP